MPFRGKLKFRLNEVTIWITSDLHFGHKNILRFSPGTRPFENIEEMDEALIKEWNDKVQPNDIIIHLGDLSFYKEEKTKEILSRLNGRKIFILGNHDWVVRNHIKVGDYGIEGIYDYLEMNVDGTKVCLLHYPMITWNSSHYGSVHFFGHCHGSLPEQKGRQMDVGYDNIGYISNIKECMDLMLQKPIHKVDGH